ncbi:MAG: hypothetical protein R3C68_00865 [Myxococcota bacterium]
MRAAVDDMLDPEFLTTGRLKLTTSLVDLSEFVKDIVANHEATFRKRQIEVTVKSSSPVNIALTGRVWSKY